MNQERIDDLVDILGEKFADVENTILIRNSLQLAQYIDDPTTWKTKQLKSRAKYRKVLISIAKKELAKINSAMEKVYLLGYREINKDSIEITETELVVKDVPKSVLKEIQKMKKKNAEALSQLATLGMRQITHQVRIIDSLSTPDTFYDVFKSQMQKGIDKGLMVTYKNGHQFTWKAYMEMNARSTIHHELTDEQIKIGTKLGIIFYVCDVYGDCANDHVDYQGKIYYNEEAEIPDEVMQFISENGIQSMQEVRDGNPFLTTRPNCRHQFHAISTEEAMGKSAEEIVKDEKLAKGTYKDGNYDKVQEQRKIERTIRKYKMRKENGDALYAMTGKKQWKPTGREDALIAKWEKASEVHAKSNSRLIKRDLDREDIRVITNDLGLRYDLKK